jgi:hypothetical protein
MKQLDNTEELLDAMSSKPAMFWGGSEYPFSSLIAFLAGYRLGFGTAADSKLAPDKLIPRDFQEFVARRLNLKGQMGGKGWETLIRESTASEEEAFALFFRLHKEYKHQPSNQR